MEPRISTAPVSETSSSAMPEPPNPRMASSPKLVTITAVRIIVTSRRFRNSPFRKSMFSSSAATRLPATPNGMPIIRKKVLPR